MPYTKEGDDQLVLWFLTAQKMIMVCYKSFIFINSNTFYMISNQFVIDPIGWQIV